MVVAAMRLYRPKSHEPARSICVFTLPSLGERDEIEIHAGILPGLYTREIPVEQVVRQFQLEPNGAAAAA